MWKENENYFQYKKKKFFLKHTYEYIYPYRLKSTKIVFLFIGLIIFKTFEYNRIKDSLLFFFFFLSTFVSFNV